MFSVGLDQTGDVLLADRSSRRGDPDMDAFEHGESLGDAAETDESHHRSELLALWSALEADRRARDERTARLRVMRLIGGEDEGG